MKAVMLKTVLPCVLSGIFCMVVTLAISLQLKPKSLVIQASEISNYEEQMAFFEAVNQSKSAYFVGFYDQSFEAFDMSEDKTIYFVEISGFEGDSQVLLRLYKPGDTGLLLME